MRVLGIDPGSHKTGYGVVEKGRRGELVSVSAGTITTTRSGTLPARLLAVSDGLDAIVEEFKPDAVSVESVFTAKNVKSAVMLAHARGVALRSAAAFGLEVFEYAPTTVKQAVVGYGRATKEQVQEMVKMLLKIDGKVAPDAADALAVAICHIHSFRAGANATKALGAAWPVKKAVHSKRSPE